MRPPLDSTIKSLSPKSMPTTLAGSATGSVVSGIVNSVTSVTSQL
jgi:hypothetical protein